MREVELRRLIVGVVLAMSVAAAASAGMRPGAATARAPVAPATTAPATTARAKTSIPPTLPTAGGEVPPAHAELAPRHRDFLADVELLIGDEERAAFLALEEAFRREARRLLERLAGETGGRAFFVDSPGELDPVYRVIEEDLRARYLIAYQSTSERPVEEFRRVEVRLVGRQGEVRTASGYWP